MDVARFLFWICVVFIFYHYLVFPLYTWLFAKFATRPVDKADRIYNISIIVAAYNEEKVIREKIRNTLSLDYPKENIEIIVASNGSTDKTKEIVDEFANMNVASLHDEKREGKWAALNHAVKNSKGEILVFTDANTILNKNAITLMLRNFNDVNVGGVSGRKVVFSNETDRQAAMGDSTFWEFESALKDCQSKTGSITTADGELFAVRKCLYEMLPRDVVNDDFSITLNIVEQGYRVVYEKDALTYESASETFLDDFNVKARIVYGGFQAIFNNKIYLLPTSDYFTFQFYSHKFLRYIMPLLLMTLYSSNLILIREHAIYGIMISAQTAFYALALVGLLLHVMDKKYKIFYYPMYYCMVNIAALKGMANFFQNKSPTDIWKKAVR